MPKRRVFAGLPVNIREEFKKHIAGESFKSYDDAVIWFEERGYTINRVTLWREAQKHRKMLERVKGTEILARAIKDNAPAAAETLGEGGLRLIATRWMDFLVAQDTWDAQQMKAAGDGIAKILTTAAFVREQREKTERKERQRAAKVTREVLAGAGIDDLELQKKIDAKINAAGGGDE